jgi:hypothetical protein
MAAGVESEAAGRIGLLWRGDRAADPFSSPRPQRLKPLIAALRRLNMAAEPVVYQDDALDSVRDQLLGLDGVLVWVNPIQDGAKPVPSGCAPPRGRGQRRVGLGPP